MTRLIAVCAAFAIAMLASDCHAGEQKKPGSKRPNVVFILTDNQGYGDLACHGNPTIKTPNLDMLHKQSTRFTNFHVDPTCSPSRAALMTDATPHAPAFGTPSWVDRYCVAMR